MIEALSKALATTSANAFIANNLWITPTIQSIHILAIAALSGSALMICLRLAGVSPRLTLPETDQRFSPWIWWPALVLLVTGTILVIGEPDRELLNVLFRLKMLMVIALLALVCVFQRGLRRSDAAWSGSGGTILALAIGTLLLAIITAGRWIAYI